MRRVLIVSPNFPPADGVDMHRVRTSLPFLSEHGYEALILALDPPNVRSPTDQHLCATVPADVRVWRVANIPERVTRRFGIRNAALRSLPHLARVGSRIIMRERVDLVYFSTTAFPVMTLGRYWRARHGVPYVLDLHDPWLSDYYSRTGARPPGGRLKYGVARALARVLEPLTVRGAREVISVSPAYPEMLLARYPAMRPDQFTVLPFGAPEQDFEVLSRVDVLQNVFDPNDGYEHWTYIGAVIDGMRLPLSALFVALARARVEQPKRFARVRLHFVGTDYAGAGRSRKRVEAIAAQYGVADIVDERPDRIPYFEALQCLRDADALLAVGSDDPGYTASKVYPYILARKPLLAIFHERSSVVDVLRRTGAGWPVTFGQGDSVEVLAGRVKEAWLNRLLRPPTTDWHAFDAYSAREMTRRQCLVFDRALARVEGT